MSGTTDPTNELLVLEACTLPTVERPWRLAEVDGLFTTAVRRVERPERLRVRLELNPDPAVAARVAELVVRETRCCSFFTFTLAATDGQVWLDIGVPAGHLAVRDAVAARAASAADSGPPT